MSHMGELYIRLQNIEERLSMLENNSIETAVKLLTDVYSSVYGFKKGTYEELDIDLKPICKFLLMNGVDVMCLMDEAEGKNNET